MIRPVRHSIPGAGNTAANAPHRLRPTRPAASGKRQTQRLAAALGAARGKLSFLCGVTTFARVYRRNPLRGVCLQRVERENKPCLTFALIRSIDTRISFCFTVWGVKLSIAGGALWSCAGLAAKGVALLSLLPCAPPRPRAGGRWRQARSASAAAGGGDTPRQCCPQRGGAAAGLDPGSCLLPSAHAVVGSVRAVVLRDSRAAGRSLAARAAPESAPPRTTGVRSPWTTLRWTQTCSAMAPLMYALRCSCSPLPAGEGEARLGAHHRGTGG